MAPTSARTRVTQPQRRFTPADLAGLARADRRKLMQLLLTESGSRVVDFQAPAGYDELVLETRPLWRPRRVRVRIADRPVDQASVDRLAAAVSTNGDAEGLLLATLGSDGHPVAPPTVMLLNPEDLIARMECCSVIAGNRDLALPPDELGVHHRRRAAGPRRLRPPPRALG